MSILISCYFMHWLININAQFPIHFIPPPRLLKFFLKYETIATPFSNLRLISFASTIVRQSEISTRQSYTKVETNVYVG